MKNYGECLPEELPGVEWDMSSGARMTTDMINEDVPPVISSEHISTKEVAVNPELDQRAEYMGFLAYTAAAAQMPESGTLIEQLRAFVDAISSPSIVEKMSELASTQHDS